MTFSFPWPWRRFTNPEVDLEDSRRALRDANAWQARSRRISQATERAIVQNHFARDIERAWPRHEKPR